MVEVIIIMGMLRFCSVGKHGQMNEKCNNKKEKVALIRW